MDTCGRAIDGSVLDGVKILSWCKTGLESFCADF
jgi:hypothetical protein